MLFLRPTIIRDPKQFQDASISKYRSFNNEQQQQRGEGSGVLDSNTVRLPGGNTYTFRQVQSSIAAFLSAGGAMSAQPAHTSDLRPVLPFAFARSQQILLLQDESATVAEAVCVPGTSALALLEARRVAGGGVGGQSGQPGRV
ncbi:hypothetical protein OS11_42840 [Dickeya oryzae]